MQHLEFFPLALLALDDLLIDAATRHAMRLALWYVLQSLTSLYSMVFSCCLAGGGPAAFGPADWVGPRARVLPLPAWRWQRGLVVVALLPFMWPYLLARQEQEMFGRTLARGREILRRVH